MSLEKDVLQELSRMRKRVDELEQLLRTHGSAPSWTPPPTPPTEQPTSMIDDKAPSPSISGGSASPGSVLGWVGALCFVLGASFLVKLAMDSGWLTPLRQIGMAAVVGIALIVVGLWYKDKDQPFVSLLPATGVSVLYVAIFGARLFYQLISPEATTLLVSVVALLSLYLYASLRQFVFVLASVLGAYICPLLLRQTQVDALGLMIFFLVWDVLFVWMSIWQRSRVILLLASYAALFSFSWPLVDKAMPDGSLLTICIFQFVQFFVFAGGITKHSLRFQTSIGKDIWAFAPLLTFFYGVQYYFLFQYTPDLAPWIAIAFAALVLGLVLVAQRGMQRPGHEVKKLVWGFLGLALYHALYLSLMSNRIQVWFSVALFLSVLALHRFRYWLARYKTLWLPMGLAVIQGYGMVLFAMASKVSTFGWILIGLMYFAGCGAIFVDKGQGSKTNPSPIWKVLLMAGYIQLLVAWIRLADQINIWVPEVSARFMVSLLWGLSALSILIWSRKIRHKALAYSSMFIFALSILKVLLLDVSSASPTLRILCLFVLGGVLFAGGYLYRQIDHWSD
jgi:uncharacterized membrane protein